MISYKSILMISYNITKPHKNSQYKKYSEWRSRMSNFGVVYLYDLLYIITKPHKNSQHKKYSEWRSRMSNFSVVYSYDLLYDNKVWSGPRYSCKFLNNTSTVISCSTFATEIIYMKVQGGEDS